MSKKKSILRYIIVAILFMWAMVGFKYITYSNPMIQYMDRIPTLKEYYQKFDVYSEFDCELTPEQGRIPTTDNYPRGYAETDWDDPIRGKDIRYDVIIFIAPKKYVTKQKKAPWNTEPAFLNYYDFCDANMIYEDDDIHIYTLNKNGINNSYSIDNVYGYIERQEYNIYYVNRFYLFETDDKQALNEKYDEIIQYVKDFSSLCK